VETAAIQTVNPLIMPVAGRRFVDNIAPYGLLA
jgi:hypothetical protein